MHLSQRPLAKTILISTDRPICYSCCCRTSRRTTFTFMKTKKLSSARDDVRWWSSSLSSNHARSLLPPTTRGGGGEWPVYQATHRRHCHRNCLLHRPAVAVVFLSGGRARDAFGGYEKPRLSALICFILFYLPH